MACEQFFEAGQPAFHADDPSLEQEQVTEIGRDALRHIAESAWARLREVIRHPLGRPEPLDVPSVHEFVARDVDDLLHAR